MKQNIHAIATALAFFLKKKEERIKRKDIGFFGYLKQALFTNKLSRRPNEESSASLINLRHKVNGLGLKAVGFFRLNAKGLRLKAVVELSQKQLTKRLPQPAPHKPEASGFAMNCA